MIFIRELACPPDIKEAEVKAAERVERFQKERNKRLSDEQIKRIEAHLKKTLKAARREFEPLRSRLTRYSDLLEGVVDETNFPFEGASNVTMRYGTGLARTFAAQFNKTVYLDEDLFYPVFDPGAEKELNLSPTQLTELQEGFNHSFSTACNGLRTLKQGTIPAFRDGTYLIEGSWERRVESVNDQRTYRSAEGFAKDYPDAQAAGISPEEYQHILECFMVEESPELIARFHYKYVMHEGIEYRQVQRAKLLVYPTTVQDLGRAVLYGFTFELSKDDLKRRAKRGEFYQKGIDRAMARRGGPGMDGWDRQRLFVEGRAAPLTEAMPYRLADVVFKYDLDEDDTLEQWCAKVITEGEEVILVSLHPYEIRHNVPSIVTFRLMSRDGAFDGISLLGDGEDIFNQVDTLFRHDNNVMMLTTSPMFMADSALKDQIDLGRAENVLRPGVTFWVPNPDKQPIRQILVQDVAAASGDNNTKMAILGRFVELLLGVNQGESGAQTPDDPRAPAHKTLLLLQQANRRIDHCIDQWCLSFQELAKLHGTLLYQFSGQEQYKYANNKGEPKNFDLKILADTRLKWSPRRRSVTLTPEFAIARLQSLLATYAQMRPLLMQGDPVAIEIWNRTVRACGEPQAEKFLIDPQQAPELAQRAIQQAVQQFKMQADMKAHAKGQEKLATEAAKHTVNFLSDQAKSGLTGAAQAEAAAKPNPEGVPA